MRFFRDGFKFARFETLKITFVNVLFPICYDSIAFLRLTESNAKIYNIFELTKKLTGKLKIFVITSLVESDKVESLECRV